VSADRPPEPTVRVLIVCTGNICRSALAERLGRAFLRDVMGERADQIRLESAGTGAVVDSAMDPRSAAALLELGAEAGDFRARQLVEGMAEQADLVLTMTRAHRRDVLHRHPALLTRTFTLREAADLLGRPDPQRPPDGLDLGSRVRGLVAEMARARSGRHSGSDDDVPDPIGQPLDVHRQVGSAIASALLPVLRRIADLDVVPRDPRDESDG
jgi:protein-tyrosine-phosphatase